MPGLKPGPAGAPGRTWADPATPAPLEHCVLTGATYANPDAASQESGRSILTSRGAGAEVPRPGGSTYTASITESQAHQVVVRDLRPPTAAKGRCRTGP
jgi:hypothetical protein